MVDKTNESTFWAAAWPEHMQAYMARPPRTGFFVDWVMKRKLKTVLELACGSSRDSIYLAKCGYAVTASDFEEKTIARLSGTVKQAGLTYAVADAFHLPFADGSFDLAFHNGLLIYFDDDDKIIELLKEQKRVASKFLVILVHNGDNPALVKQYEGLGETDALYRIRFFTRSDLDRLIDRAGLKPKSRRFLKFGSRLDLAYKRKIRFVPNPMARLAPSLVPALYQCQPWAVTERICCVLEF